MGKRIDIAVIDPKTGNPVYDGGKLVTRTVDSATGARVKRKAPAKNGKTTKSQKDDGGGG